MNGTNGARWEDILDRAVALFAEGAAAAAAGEAERAERFAAVAFAVGAPEGGRAHPPCHP